MNKLKKFRTDFSILITKHIGPQNLLITLGFLNILEAYINGFGLTVTGILFFLCLIINYFLPPFKKYKFKAKKKDCLELFLQLQNRFPQYNFGNDFYIEEVFDQKNNFLYTLLLVPFGSDYRVPIEVGELYNKTSLSLPFSKQS